MHPEAHAPAAVHEAGVPSRRSEDRITPGAGRQRRLSLRATAWDGDRPVAALRNVSTGGASLVLTGAAPVPREASLVLELDGVRLVFLSRVVWQRDANGQDLHEAGLGEADDACVIGLQVRGPGSLAAMLA